MRIIFSRKGFDSASGGGASPIVDGRPISLPIPTGKYSATTYGDLGLGELAATASRGKIGPEDACHHDPMFLDNKTCLFGQCGAAQTHLTNRGVTIGDAFVFFGLFREEETGEPHHRIFGYLQIAESVDLSTCGAGRAARLADVGHPHALGMHARNNVVYVGLGATATHAGDVLRLTVSQGPPSLWNRPEWLKRGGLSYHDRASRWLPGGRLQSVARGQEFVADIGNRKKPRDWLDGIIAEINRSL